MTQQQNLPLESTDRIAAVVAANAAVQSSKARTVFQTSKIRTRHSSYYLLRSIQAMFFTILLTLCTSSSFAFQAPPPPTTTTTHLLIGVKHEKSALLSSQRFALKSGGGNVEQDWNTANNSTDFDDNKRGTVGATYNATAVSHRRRSLLFRSGLVVASPIMMMLSQPEQSSAVLSFGTTVGGEKESRVVFYSPNKNASDALQSEQSDLSTYALNSEICLLKLLPVKNPTFRGLERSVVGLSSLKTAPREFFFRFFLGRRVPVCCCTAIFCFTISTNTFLLVRFVCLFLLLHHQQRATTPPTCPKKKTKSGSKIVGKGKIQHDGCNQYSRQQAFEIGSSFQ